MADRVKFAGANEFVPATTDVPRLARAAGECRGCDLYERATQTVFGRGPSTAEIMLVGEQPGDVEDTEGRAFVGPAGGVLSRAIAEAGIDESTLYVTNAVKHFRWTTRGNSKRRIHEKPSAGQSTACRPWLRAELRAVRPTVLVALGATAAASLLGSGFRLTQHRGEVLSWPPERGDFSGDDTAVAAVLATIHPSAILRADDADRAEMYDGLVRDLTLARERCVS